MKDGVWMSVDTRNKGSIQEEPAWWVGNKLWWLMSSIDFVYLMDNYPFERDYEVEKINLLLPQEFME